MNVSGDNVRWLGTTLIAGLIALLSIFYCGQLALREIPIPEGLIGLAALGGGAFFTAFGSMVGGRATQNGVVAGASAANTVAQPQPPSPGGLGV